MNRKVATVGFLLAATAIAPQATLAGAECRCRLFAEKVAIGTVSCVRGKLMQCLMFQNTPSWKVVGEVCPMAEQNVDPRENVEKPAKTPSPS